MLLVVVHWEGIELELDVLNVDIYLFFQLSAATRLVGVAKNWEIFSTP